MAHPEELAGIHDFIQCDECDYKMKLEAHYSPAGYYLGYICPRHGPWSRETGYFKTRELAEKALKDQTDMNLRDTDYHG